MSIINAYSSLELVFPHGMSRQYHKAEKSTYTCKVLDIKEYAQGHRRRLLYAVTAGS